MSSLVVLYPPKDVATYLSRLYRSNLNAGASRHDLAAIPITSSRFAHESLYVLNIWLNLTDLHHKYNFPVLRVFVLTVQWLKLARAPASGIIRHFGSGSWLVGPGCCCKRSRCIFVELNDGNTSTADVSSDVRYMLSPIRLSSVTFVHPTQPVEIFGNISSLFGTLAIH